MRISYSALETYAQCPQKYKFQEIDRIKATKSREALFGTAIHGALQFMFSRDPLFPTLEEILAHFRGSFTEKTALSEQDRTRYVEIGEKMIRSYYQKNPPWNYQVVDLELHFEVVLVDKVYDAKHLLVGKIDRIDKRDDGTYEIIDYKTSRKLPSQDAVDNNTQLAVYQLGLQKRWPHIEPGTVTLSLYFLRAGEKLSTKRSANTLARVEENILARIHTIEKKIEENDFPPTPSALCDWCGYKPICPAWRHLYEKEKKLPDGIQIEEAVKEYFDVRKAIEEHKKRLTLITASIHEYFNTQKLERAFGPNGSIMRTIQERITWDTSKIKEILQGQPIWEELLVVDPKKLAAVLGRLPYETRERLKNEARIVRKFTMLKTSKKKEKLG